jgi:heme/copper-type cytochrome/quinol oxidase subunit 2
LAALCLAASVFLAAWRWSSLTSHMRHRRQRGTRARIQMSAAATLLALMALLVWSVQAGRFSAGALAHKPPSNSNSPITAGTHPAADYVGVILLPPKVEKKEIVAPAPRTPAITLGLAKPVVIPFDGPYWFFKAPARRPARDAHVAHGKPTEVNVHSSDLDPLRMEAHQTLGSVVDLRCCSALDLRVLNADKRPGTIDLGILLTDNTAPGRPSLYLGEQTLPSTTPLVIPRDRAPVEETLHFTIPREARSLRFNEITVLFHTAPFHARYAAKIEIRNFVLIPR